MIGKSRLRVANAIRHYLKYRFPLGPQGGTVLAAYACCYLLYGQAHGDHVVGLPTAAGGITAVLLALVRRITDDIEDLSEDIRSGRASFADGGKAHLRGLVLGWLGAVAMAAALNAPCGIGLVAVAVGVAVWFALATIVKHLVARSRNLCFVVNETCPAALLLYSYVVWRAVAHSSLPALTVVAVVGLFWTTYQFWNFTRKVGAEGWPPWGLTLAETRVALLVLLAIAVAFNALLAAQSVLPLPYLLYGVVVSLVFAARIQVWWARLPRAGSRGVGADWGGLPFPLAVVTGVLIAVLGSSLS